MPEPAFLYEQIPLKKMIRKDGKSGKNRRRFQPDTDRAVSVVPSISRFCRTRREGI